MQRLGKEEYEKGLESLLRKIKEEKLVPLVVIGYQENDDHVHSSLITPQDPFPYKEIIEDGIIQLEEKLSEPPKLNNPD